MLDPDALVPAVVDGDRAAGPGADRRGQGGARAWTTTGCPTGVEAEWVSVGGSIVEALLWGRGALAHLAAGHRRPRPGRCTSSTADADPGRAPVGRGARRGCTSPTPPSSGRGWSRCVAADLGATLVDPTIAYLTSDARADSPWVSSYRVDRRAAVHLKKLKALLRARGIGRVVVKKRGSADRAGGAGQAAARHRRRGTAVVVVTRVAGVPTVLVCEPCSVPLSRALSG